MAYAAALKPTMSQQAAIDLMISMRDAMLARGECAENGGATIANMAKELRVRGAIIPQDWEVDYRNAPMDPTAMHDLIKAHAGVHPIVLQVQNALALVDSAGTHEDTGVHDHAIYIAGIAAEGYVVGDPNNPAVMSSWDIYPYDAGGYGLLAAQPIGMLILDFPKPPLPGGITDDGAALHFANVAYPVPEPFRTWLLARGPASLGAPLAEMVTSALGASQLFQLGELRHTDANGVYLGNIGADLAAARAQVDEALAKLDTITHQLALVKANVQQTLADLG
ncbi:MAG: hypothetical protein KGH75_00660 [Rhodospirillales bacterium]|nr:hypothetical protein [Rhodospirillales bacterium]